ncbi:hypothetical protein Tco_0556767 [Tanacetum coccineum]
MANLEFCDKHNMVAYLKKPSGSEGFQEIVDFLNVDNGEQEITAIVDGKEFTVTEASIRRHLQLADVDGISVLPTTEIFDQLSLMGVPTPPCDLPLLRVHTLGSDEGSIETYKIFDGGEESLRERNCQDMSFQKEEPNCCVSLMRGIQPDSSKQGRMIEEIDQDTGVTLRLRIEQYFQVQDYALWDVIENRNSFKPATKTTTNADGTSTTLIPGPVTTEEKVQKKNDVKARSMLLMALPNEHLMTFNQYKDAKTLFAAIQTRFGGNEATKKTQKTLLKQMYENFSAPSTESLDSIFNRLQKIVSQLAILGENISQEDLNLKFLRSLPSEWNTHVVVWRNKPDLDTMSFDDLYNNFKIVEQEVKGTTSSSSSSHSQNMDFVSSPSSTNEVNTAYGVSTANTQVSPASTQVSPASTQVSTASTQVSTANLSDDTVYAFLASQPNGSQLVYEDLEQIHEDDIEEIDLKWQLALLSMRTRRFF